MEHKADIDPTIIATNYRYVDIYSQRIFRIARK